jgi:hypothetical protein
MHKPTKLNTKGFGHIVVVIAIAVVVVVGGAGYAVYKHQNKAHAGGYTAISTDPNHKIVGCSTYHQSNAYGNFYTVTIVYGKPASVQNEQYTLQVIRKGKIISQQTQAAWYLNTTASLSATLSAPLGDSMDVGMNIGNAGFGIPVQPYSLTNC